MKPELLLSVNENPNVINYIDAVENCGGAATALYCPTVSHDGYDGLILCGGSDIAPEKYGEAVGGAVSIDRKRDDAESELLASFIAAGKPVLGICRGCQLINVYFGGSLHQHLPSASIHSSGTAQDLVHAVDAAEGSVCEGLYGKTFFVNSAHHQAIKRVGGRTESDFDKRGRCGRDRAYSSSGVWRAVPPRKNVLF